MTPPKTIMRGLYHTLLSLILRLCGLSIADYKIFYWRVLYKLPITEPLLQMVRPRSKAEEIIGPETLRGAQQGGVVLDIGANVGSISSMFLTLGFIVHAYEPDSRCIQLLRSRFKWTQQGRITIHHAAVSDEDGEVQLNYGSTTTESNSILFNKPGADGSGGAESVISISIRNLIEDHGYVSIIKMDIEGAEYDVLDTLLHPAFIDRFGICIVETHARKIPGLMPRQHLLEEKIRALGLTERVLLSWH